VSIDLNEGKYTVKASNDLRNLARIRYFNRESFRAIDSSDTFGDWVDQIPLFKGAWGGGVTDFSGGTTKRTSGGPPGYRSAADSARGH
jgi:hypothetical protein